MPKNNLGIVLLLVVSMIQTKGTESADFQHLEHNPYYSNEHGKGKMLGENDADCINDPTAKNCMDFSISDDEAYSYVEKLCGDMPLMSGCYIRDSACSSRSKDLPPYCAPFSLLASICDKDMPRMGKCQVYTSLCNTPGSVVRQCDMNPALQSLPTTKLAYSLVESICNEMDMSGCEKCRGSNECNRFKVYLSLCQQMPGMKQCRDFHSMCNWNPSLLFCPASAPAHGTPGDHRMLAPSMKMYFHFGINDYILLENWVPQGPISFLFACAFCFIVSLAYEYLLLLNAQIESKWRKQLLASSSSIVNSPSRSRGDRFSQEEEQLLHRGLVADGMGSKRISMIRGLMRIITISGAYILMLLIMTYNVILFLFVVSGLGFGSYCFGQEIINLSTSSLVDKDCC